MLPDEAGRGHEGGHHSATTSCGGQASVWLEMVLDGSAVAGDDEPAVRQHLEDGLEVLA
jgi:hypothetical protein